MLIFFPPNDIIHNRKAVKTMTDKEKQTFLKEFGYRVKQHRIEKEMSQEELANLVGYTSDNARSSIQKIESGKSDLPASKIRILAEVLNIPIEKLMGWDHKEPTEEDLQEWEKKYNPGGKLAAEVNILEEIQKQHGKTASEAFGLYTQLDSDDQGEIRGEMKHMLKSDKYSTQEGSLNGKAI